MTLPFIVGRILRELIELAERDADAELVDALVDALAMSRRRRRRTEVNGEPRGPGPGLRRLGTFRRAERQVGAGRDRDCPLGRMMREPRWRVMARGRGLFAIEVDDGGGFRAATAVEGGNGNCSGRRSTRRVASTTRPNARVTSTSVDGSGAW